MTPQEYSAIRRKNTALIRRLQREIDFAEEQAVDAPEPDRNNLRPTTIGDIRAGKVFWIDYGDEGLGWKIPSDEPHPTATHCIDIDGEPAEWAGSFVENDPAQTPATGASADTHINQQTA